MGIFSTTGGQVNFPGLGVTFEHLVEGFQIFGLHISLSGILIALAMFLGLFITERLAKKTEQNTEQYLDLAIRVVVAGLIGARIGYVITHWEYFLSDQENVFDIRDGGMSAAGAVIAGVLTSFLYCRKKKLSWLTICDTSMPGIVMGQILASVGCFFGRNMLGTYSDGAFAMQISLQDADIKAVALSRSSSQMIRGSFLQVHPVAIYEAVLLLLLLLILFIAWKRKKLSGILFSIYLIGYGVMLFFMEFIRLDSMKLMDTCFSLEHINAVILIAVGAFILTGQIRKNRAVQKAQPKKMKTLKK